MGMMTTNLGLPVLGIPFQKQPRWIEMQIADETMKQTFQT